MLACLANFSIDCTVGVGTRQCNSVKYLFEYPNGLFSNTFIGTAQPTKENSLWILFDIPQFSSIGAIP